MNEQRTGPRSGRPQNLDSVENVTFTRNLRYELASEEGRALAGSYGISFLLAAAFLLFVYLYPPIEPEPKPRIIVLDLPPEQPVQQPVPEPEPEPTPDAAAPAQPQQRPQPRQPRPSSPRTTTTSTGDVTGAFSGQAATGGVAGSVAGALRGVDVRTGTGGAPGGGGTGQRAVITGSPGSGTAGTPGRGGVASNAGAASGIGDVTGTGSVTRGSVGVRAPSVIQPPAIGESRDMGDLGAYVRSRNRELQFCYEEHGLKVNPSLGGTIHVSIGIAGSGRVTSASVNRRTWGGAGASAVESCVLGKIRAWRFPSSSAGDGVYSFPFNFTR